MGKEVCSGLFSERIFDFLPECKRLVQNQINFCLISFPKRTVRIRFSKPFFVISHYQLDNLAADLAQEAGAKIVLNQEIKSLPEGYDRIIGCDGANSFVRKSLRLPDPRLWLAIQGFTSDSNSADYVETWPTKAGFIWKIPRCSETEWGIIEKPDRTANLFNEFLAKRNIHLSGTKSALVPQGLIIPKNPDITLCGDAVGLTKPWSGGGVIWGLSAADLLLKNFPDFIKYRSKIKRFFLPKIILSKTAKKIIYFLGFNLPWFLPKNPKIESDFLT
jgi:flavin-dependent dehydrogenase